MRCLLPAEGWAWHKEHFSRIASLAASAVRDAASAELLCSGPEISRLTFKIGSLLGVSTWVIVPSHPREQCFILPFLSLPSFLWKCCFPWWNEKKWNSSRVTSLMFILCYSHCYLGLWSMAQKSVCLSAFWCLIFFLQLLLTLLPAAPWLCVCSAFPGSWPAIPCRASLHYDVQPSSWVPCGLLGGEGGCVWGFYLFSS